MFWKRTSGVLVSCAVVLFADGTPSHSASFDGNQNIVVIEELLSQLDKWRTDDKQERPYVTVSFAQSTNGYLAVLKDEGPSSNYPISGPESLHLVHALRSRHDGILVGGRTLAIDNPRLNNRLYASTKQPRPIVLDTNLRHVQELLQKGSSSEKGIRARNLILCCSHQAAEEMAAQRTQLPDDHTLIPCRQTVDGRLDLHDVLRQLKAMGIQSLMVEGGSTLLEALFAENLVDAVCITIAPLFIERGQRPKLQTKRLEDSVYVPLGADCILLGKWISKDKKDDAHSTPNVPQTNSYT